MEYYKKFIKHINNLISSFLEIFFEYSCLLCYQKTSFRKVLCEECNNYLLNVFNNIYQVKDINFELEAYYFADYKDLVSEAIKMAKYKPSKLLAIELGKIASINLAKNWKFDIPDCLIPVPIHESRLKVRGFNQAEIYAKYFSNVFKVSVADILVRKRITRYQAECSKKERLSNVYNVFEVRGDLDISEFQNKKLCVIDDVLTTGATLYECSNTLQKLKPKKVFCLTLAHSSLNLK